MKNKQDCQEGDIRKNEKKKTRRQTKVIDDKVTKEAETQKVKKKT